MQVKNLSFVLLLSVTVCFSCKKGSFPNDKVIPPDEDTPTLFQSDLRELKDQIMLDHPRKFSFLSEPEFEELYDDLYGQIDENTTREEFFVKASKLIASIGCGHSRIDIPDFFYQGIASRNLLPFAFLVREGEVRIYYKYGQSSVPVGATILSINGIGIETILEQLKSMISADGNRETGKENKLSLRFRNYFALAYGIFDEFQIKYEINGAQQEETVAAMTYQAIIDEFRANYYTGPTADYEFEIEGSMAVLKMGTFYFPDGTTPYYNFIADCFEQIERNNIQDLIIDIRGNFGGDPYCAAFLISYLLDEEFPYFASSAYGHDDLKLPIEKKVNAFSGNLYVLIDGGVFSTAGHFAALLKYHNLGVFIGQETDGAYSCNDASNDHVLTNSGIKYRLARLTFSVEVSGMSLHEGVVPDHEIKYTIEDIINETDVELEFAKSLISFK